MNGALQTNARGPFCLELFRQGILLIVTKIFWQELQLLFVNDLPSLFNMEVYLARLIFMFF